MPEENKKLKLYTPQDDSSPDRECTSDTIVRDVVRGLYEGRYVPGQRLVEPDMMREYGVSRSTVRETIKQLTADGIANYVQFRGAHIRRLTRRDAANIFAITEVILGLATRQAAENIEQPGAKDELLDCVAAICGYEDGKERFEFIRLRNRFFQKVVQISGNTELNTIIPKLQVHLVRNRLLVPKAEREAGYSMMAQEILSGNGERAETATREYVQKIAGFTLPYFEEEVGTPKKKQGKQSDA